jgi:metallo-beta-lactamase family protein
MKVIPIGAAGEVTGSSFLVKTRNGTYLVDCGVFQGHTDDDVRNLSFPFDPTEIDAVFLTHAHLDHCGRLPYLHALGFRGQVYATPATCDLAQFILLDAARLQTEDFLRHYRRGRRSGMPTPPPMYDEQDVLHLMRYFHPHPYGKMLPIGSDLQVVFHQSGHILGSSAIEVRNEHSSVLFSGDVGSPGRNVVPDFTSPPRTNLVFCESTYGDRLHRTEEASINELAEAINWAYQAGGNVVIPAFALERTQDLLFDLRALRDAGKVPLNTVFMDSPLAINLTKVYEHHIHDLDENTRALVKAHDDPFRFDGLTQCLSPGQSQLINGQSGVVIIAGSGMCTGGRVVHHLKHNLWRSDSAVVFIGYQANGTLGRRLVDGAKKVTIEHEPVRVNARRFTINGFSAHADQAGLLQWLGHTGNARIILNHGEPAASSILAGLLQDAGRTVEVAKPDMVYEV